MGELSDEFDYTTAERLTRDRMSLYGHTQEQITAAEQVSHESAGCVNEHPYGWICTDEDDKPLHPDRDELESTAEFVTWVLEHPLLEQSRQAREADWQCQLDAANARGRGCA